MPDTGLTNWPADTDDLNIPGATGVSPLGAGDGHYTFKQWLERVTGMLRATAHDLLTGMTHDLPMGNHKITGLATPTSATDAVTKAYADALIALADAMVFKGVIDSSSNPNYPAADRGWTYRVSVAGKIGGASGTNVEVGDLLLCLTDGTAAGTQAAVGAQWEISQANIDGAVVGPATSTDSALALFNGAGGKVIKDSGIIVDTDGTLAANSDLRIATQKATKAYITAVAVLPWIVDVNLLFPPASSVNLGGDPVYNPSSTWYVAHRQSSGAQNDEMTYNVVLGAGTWTLVLHHFAATNRGKYKFSLGGTLLSALGGSADTIDGYAGSGTTTQSTITGIVVPTTAKYALRILMDTKNASSSGYYCTASWLQLQRTA